MHFRSSTYIEASEIRTAKDVFWIPESSSLPDQFIYFRPAKSHAPIGQSGSAA